jgi:hypothetical protein
MNPTSAQFLKTLSRRGRRFIRTLSAMLCVFLLAVAPVLAEPVTVKQVVQTISSSQGAPDLRINNLVAQDPGKGTQQNGPRNESTAQAGESKPASIISGVTVSEGQQIGVDISEEGEVEGTVCDCGEILVAGASFPKWPFLFLAAVPLIFIHHDDCVSCNDTSDSTPTPTPPSTPTPTPPGVPEPASLFLFGTGVAAFGAALRRRYGKGKQLEAEERGE